MAERESATLMRSPLARYRVIAIVVGIGLVILVCIGVPVKYVAGHRIVVAIVGPIHGVLYILYVLATLDLAVRRRWSLVRTLLVALAGTVPFMSFVAERKVVGWSRPRETRA